MSKLRGRLVKKRFFILVTVFMIIIFSLQSIAFANQYATLKFNNISYHGIKADFKVPNLIEAGWDSSSNLGNFLNYEMWFAVNSQNDWFELGAHDGGFSEDGVSNITWYRGFFKAKCINGSYLATKLNVGFTGGSTYTLQIDEVTDTNPNLHYTNKWEIWVGSTCYGQFADICPTYSGSTNDFGVETQQTGDKQPKMYASTITTHKYLDSNFSWQDYSTKQYNFQNDISFGIRSSYTSSTKTESLSASN